MIQIENLFQISILNSFLNNAKIIQDGDTTDFVILYPILEFSLVEDYDSWELSE